jgi:hypothetical protein
MPNPEPAGPAGGPAGTAGLRRPVFIAENCNAQRVSAIWTCPNFARMDGDVTFTCRLFFLLSSPLFLLADRSVPWSDSLFFADVFPPTADCSRVYPLVGGHTSRIPFGGTVLPSTNTDAAS